MIGIPLVVAAGGGGLGYWVSGRTMRRDMAITSVATVVGTGAAGGGGYLWTKWVVNKARKTKGLQPLNTEMKADNFTALQHYTKMRN